MWGKKYVFMFKYERNLKIAAPKTRRIAIWQRGIHIPGSGGETVEILRMRQPFNPHKNDTKPVNVKTQRSYKTETYTGLFISPFGISELDCATTKTDTAERSISIGRESLQVFFLY